MPAANQPKNPGGGWGGLPPGKSHRLPELVIALDNSEFGKY